MKSQVYVVYAILSVLPIGLAQNDDKVQQFLEKIKGCNETFTDDEFYYAMRTSEGEFKGQKVIIIDDEIGELDNQGVSIYGLKAYCKRDEWLSPVFAEFWVELFPSKSTQNMLGLSEKCTFKGEASFSNGEVDVKISSLEGMSEKMKNQLEKSFNKKQKLDGVDTLEVTLFRIAVGRELPKSVKVFSIPEDRPKVLTHDVTVKKEEDGTFSVLFGGGRLGVSATAGQISVLIWKKRNVKSTIAAQKARFMKIMREKQEIGTLKEKLQGTTRIKLWRLQEVGGKIARLETVIDDKEEMKALIKLLPIKMSALCKCDHSEGVTFCRNDAVLVEATICPHCFYVVVGDHYEMPAEFYDLYKALLRKK